MSSEAKFTATAWLLWLLCLGGCADNARAPASPAAPDQARSSPPPEAAPAGDASADHAPADHTPATQPSTTAPSPPAASGQPVVKPKKPLAGTKPHSNEPAAAQAQAPAPRAPAAGPAPLAAGTAPPATAPAPMDLAALKQRLRDTNAIGVFTKLALKNQVDDLLDKFRNFYRGEVKITLPQLRQSYELLLQKVLALLQDSDPSLAKDIVASREAIWALLADPQKFATL